MINMCNDGVVCDLSLVFDRVDVLSPLCKRVCFLRLQARTELISIEFRMEASEIICIFQPLATARTYLIYAK